MKNKKIKSYEAPEVEIVSFNCYDIVTASAPFGDDMDNDGWTTV